MDIVNAADPDYHIFVDRNERTILAGDRVRWGRHHGKVELVTESEVVIEFDDFLGFQTYSMLNAQRNIVKEH